MIGGRRQPFLELNCQDLGALPASLSYDGSNDLLDPTRGFRLAGRFSPEASLQDGFFGYGKGQIDASAYRGDEGLVLTWTERSLVDAGTGTPAMLLAGIALLWRQADEAQRERWLDSTGRIDPIRAIFGGGGWAAYFRVFAGLSLVVTALILFAVWSGSFEFAGPVIVAALLGVAGLAIVVGPWALRLVHDLGAERAERVRTQERADMAAHLHDSVLQTLALIQKNAHDATTVARLARGRPPAEAVADLIAAATPLQARAAFDQLEGTLTDRIAAIDGELFDHLGEIVLPGRLGGAAGDGRHDAQTVARLHRRRSAGA